jgi:large subunit ribosomal protein L10
MNREEKHELVLALQEKMQEFGNFYIADTSSLSVEKINNIRRKCFESGIEMQVAKNTLIRKAIEGLEGDASEIFTALKGQSALLFSTTGNGPAKLIKALRKTSDKPLLKGAYIDTAVYVGDNQLDALVSLKSREELIGDIIGLLQSPAKNVVSALKSSGGKIAGIVKTLQEREG